MNWKKLIKPWIPEKENEEISGKLIRIEEEVGENKSMMYTLETDKNIQGVWGSAVIDAKLKFFKVGDFVKIIFLGKKEGNRKESYKNFEVFFGTE